MARISLVPQNKQFFRLLERASDNAVSISRQLVQLLDAFPSNGTNLREIKELEHEGDRLVRDAVAELFNTVQDPIVIIRWKDIHERLEEACDALENAADVLEAILVKNR